MRKNLYGKILKGKPKEQHLSTVYKSYSYVFMIYYVGLVFYTKLINLAQKFKNLDQMGHMAQY